MIRKLINIYKTRHAYFDSVNNRYSLIECEALSGVLTKIKSFMSQYGQDSLTMEIYANPKRFNPLIVSEKPIFEESWNIGDLLPLTSINEELGGFLFLLAYRLHPVTVFELGTHFGISGMYLAAGLSLNPRGFLYTMDRSVNILRHTKINLNPWKDRVNMITGEFKDMFPDIIPKRKNIDLAFIDGDHHKGAMTQYFNLLLPAITAGGAIVFDDITWSSYAAEDWKTISTDKHVFFSKDCGRFGFVVVK